MSTSPSSVIANKPFELHSSAQTWHRISGRTLAFRPEPTDWSPLTCPKHNFSRTAFKDAGPSQETSSISPKDGETAFHFQQLNTNLPSHSMADYEGGSCSNTVMLYPVEKMNSLLWHDSSCSLLSVRLEPIDESRISPSGRRALKKLRNKSSSS